MYKGMVLTDLDGTLLDSEKIVSQTNLDALHNLGKNNFVRVAATGRSIYTSSQVLHPNFPIDYLIFSTGAGILNWKTKEVIHSNSLTTKEITEVHAFLQTQEANFVIHHEIPQNHHFTYFKNSAEESEFEKRIGFYKNFATAGKKLELETATSFLIIIKDGHKLLEELRNKFNWLSIIRTTSPFDHKTMWIEMFPNSVSKGHTAEWLCDKLNICPKRTMSIGNDYNDLAMLEWTANSFIVNNAPEDLKQKFSPVRENDKDGFAHAVEIWLKGFN
jgi:Cof subfamily protein (haloacid dehalogenase superfamily)